MKTRPNKLRIRIANLNTAFPIRWQRSFRQQGEGGDRSQEAADESNDKQTRVAYTSRKIRCIRCEAPQETKHIQLFTRLGFRDIHCGACGLHERCITHLCDCNVQWRRCPLHKVDPPVHASRRGLGKYTKKKDSSKGDNMVRLKSRNMG